MLTFITILIAIVCVLLILVVLIQKPKGGGLSSNFSGGSQFMGVKKTNDIIERTTWTLAIVLFALSLLINFWIPRNDEGTVATTGESILKDKIEAAPAPTRAPQPAAAQPQDAAKPADSAK